MVVKPSTCELIFDIIYVRELDRTILVFEHTCLKPLKGFLPYKVVFSETLVLLWFYF
jgi:hypothetical protein